MGEAGRSVLPPLFALFGNGGGGRRPEGVCTSPLAWKADPLPASPIWRAQMGGEGLSCLPYLRSLEMGEVAAGRRGSVLRPLVWKADLSYRSWENHYQIVSVTF